MTDHDGWKHRHYDAPMPYQTWNAFPLDAIVQIKNRHGDTSIGRAGEFWWGYETECGETGEGVIVAARRLDRPRTFP